MGLGHLQSLRPLAEGLRERGHRVSFALRDLSRAHAVLGEDAPVVPVPVWNPPPAPSRPPAGHAELLARLGYLDAPAMAGFSRGWRELFRLLRPDLLVCEHAPTALLASRGLGIARAAMGTGFTCPPPRPGLRFAGPGKDDDPLEARLLRALNETLGSLGAPALQHVGELHAADAQLVCTFAELDPYRAWREAGDYWGPRGGQAQGTAPAWPRAGQQRVLAYLKPASPGFEAMMDALARSGARVLAFTPGAPAAITERYASDRLALTTRPVAMAAALADCDLVVCHGGHGTTCAALLAGVPVLIAPAQLEQSLTAARVRAIGAGEAWLPGSGADPLPALRRLLSQSGPREAARRFAEAHAAFDEAAASRAICERLEALLQAS